jgi:hypothetical protein
MRSEFMKIDLYQSNEPERSYTRNDISTCSQRVDRGIHWKERLEQGYLERRCLPPTKPEDEELEIISHMTFVINPALRLKRLRVGVDFRISRDGPETKTVRYLKS